MLFRRNNEGWRVYKFTEMNRIIILLLILSLCGSCKVASVSSAFTNPVVYADVPDMDVIRVGDDFYMMSTTMHLMPGAPVMRSKDLVNWEIISYVFDRLTDTSNYDLINGTVYGRGNGLRRFVIIKGSFMYCSLPMISLIAHIFILRQILQESGSY